MDGIGNELAESQKHLVHEFGVLATHIGKAGQADADSIHKRQLLNVDVAPTEVPVEHRHYDFQQCLLQVLVQSGEELHEYLPGPSEDLNRLDGSIHQLAHQHLQRLVQRQKSGSETGLDIPVVL